MYIVMPRASAALLTPIGTPKEGSTLAATFMPNGRPTRLPVQLRQRWLSRVTGTGRDQLLMLSGRVERQRAELCLWLSGR